MSTENQACSCHATPEFKFRQCNSCVWRTFIYNVIERQQLPDCVTQPIIDCLDKDSVKSPDNKTIASATYRTLVKLNLDYSVSEVARWFNCSGKDIWKKCENVPFDFSISKFVMLIGEKYLNLSNQLIKEILGGKIIQSLWWETKSFQPRNIAASIIWMALQAPQQNQLNVGRTCGGTALCNRMQVKVATVRNIVNQFNRCHPNVISPRITTAPEKFFKGPRKLNIILDRIAAERK